MVCKQMQQAHRKVADRAWLLPCLYRLAERSSIFVRAKRLCLQVHCCELDLLSCKHSRQ